MSEEIKSPIEGKELDYTNPGHTYVLGFIAGSKAMAKQAGKDITPALLNALSFTAWNSYQVIKARVEEKANAENQSQAGGTTPPPSGN